MAIGFTPRHILKQTLLHTPTKYFMVVAAETAAVLNWDITYLSDSGIIAETKSDGISMTQTVKIKLIEDELIIESTSNTSILTDWGRNKKNTKQALLIFSSISKMRTEDQLAERYEILKKEYTIDTFDLLAGELPAKQNRFSSFAAIFAPVDGYFVTPIIVVLNTMVFLLMLFSGISGLSPDNNSLVQWGGNSRESTIGGEWWRLFTCNFVHIGFAHLLTNMIILIYIGALLEPRIGKVRFVFAYILSGIGASVLSLIWLDNVISVGASGAILGLYGILIILLLANLVDKSAKKPLLAGSLIFVAYALMSGIDGRIDNAAHIGGLSTGLLVGAISLFELKKQTPDI